MKTTFIPFLFMCMSVLFTSCELILDLLEEEKPYVCSSIQAVNSEKQYGTAGDTLSAPLQVKVTNDIGDPLSNVTVIWKIVSGNGELSQDSTQTDSLGIAQVEWILGSSAGEQKASASVQPRSELCPTMITVEFTAEVLTLKLTTAKIELFEINTEECFFEGDDPEAPLQSGFDTYIAYESNTDISKYYIEVEDETKFESGASYKIANEGEIEEEEGNIYVPSCVLFADDDYYDTWYTVRLYELKDGEKTGEALVTSNKIGPFRVNKPANANRLAHDANLPALSPRIIQR